MKYANSMRSDRPGIALVTVVLILLACGALAAGAAMMTSNAWLINRYNVNQSKLESAANAGLAETRAVLNFNPTVYPNNGYVILEDSVPVDNAYGDRIPGVWRSTYVGPTGSTTGQYGVYGSIVVVANDRAGDRVIRRLQVAQESFAKFAYFTDNEPNDIAFGGGDQIFGPVHSNDEIKVYNDGATFHGPVTTAETVDNDGTYEQGYTENAAVIPMPDMADLQDMADLATDASMSFNAGPENMRPQMRIEFIPVDLNGDGDRTDGNEGFVRVYQSSDPLWLAAYRPPNFNNCANPGLFGCSFQPRFGLTRSANCGDFNPAHGGNFLAAVDHNPPATEDRNTAVTGPTATCFLGGDPALFGGFNPNDGQGQWIRRNLPVPDALDALNRPDENYLFPITRNLNVNFKGVIFVNGSVAVSGVVRGHVTLVATGDILIVDDLTYATDPGADNRNCLDNNDANDDVLGVFSGDSIIVADNTINSPIRPRGSGGGNYRTYDNRDDSYQTHEYIYGTLLTLQSFAVENFDSGSDNDESCLSPPNRNGRGCLFLTGGIVQQTRGAVGTQGGTGYVKRYSYDKCVAATPPPYFPTTGHFNRGRYFQVDPARFNVDDFFDRLTSS